MSFWREKTLAEMSDSEWESLCDGCARCCLIKLQDEDTDEVAYTAIVCDLLDEATCRCTRYPQRHQLVPDCIEINAGNTAALSWLPTTCAYRRIAEGLDLPDWHPLVSGSPESVHDAGISVRGKVIAERHVHPDEEQDYIVHWIDTGV